MNGPGDIPLTHSSTPDSRPCSLISIIPTLGMSSCRGRAEAFARKLSSKLRTLGSQSDDELNSQEDEPIINGGSNNNSTNNNVNTWLKPHESEQPITDLQPLRHESDSFFDFDCELESPGSPVDECEYLRLIETASNTPHNSAPESGYVCASTSSSHSSSDGPYYDVINSDSSSSLPPKTREATLKANGHSERLLENGEQSTVAAASTVDGSNKTETTKQDMKVDAVESTHGTEVTHTLPTTGPDVKNMMPQEEQAVTLDSPEMVLSDHERVQLEDVLNELQKQSNEFVDASVPRLEESIATDSIRTKSNERVVDNISDETVTHLKSNDLRVQSNDSGFVNRSAAISTDLVSSGNQTKIKMAVECDTYVIQPQIDVVIESKCNTQEILHTTMNGNVDDGEEVLKIEMTEIDSNSTDGEAKVDAHGIDKKMPSLNAEETKNEISTLNTSKETHLCVLDTTDDEDDCRPQRIRRCSSLKTGKTPPGTPGRKKIVRFADVLGLDLADVKTFLDEVPTIPKSAFEDLEIMESEPPIQLGPKSDKLLMPLFQQPGGLPSFLDIVREKQVSLENAAVTDTINQTISGSVRVRNLDFHKSVHIRYSLDNWRSFADLQANYVQNSCDGFSDKFTFVLFGNSLHIGQRIEFAVRFQCKGQQFWDNNYGTNYCFQCLPSSNPAGNPIPPFIPSPRTTRMVDMQSPTACDVWCNSFY